MTRRALAFAALALAIVLLAAGSPVVVSGQLLAYQDGYVFFTTGDGFRVAHDVVIRDAKTGGATRIQSRAPGVGARDVRRERNGDRARPFARAAAAARQLRRRRAVRGRDLVARSQPRPAQGGRNAGARARRMAATQHFSGRPVLVTFIVQVPPYTPFTSSIYIATDQSGWNAQAIPMDRIDALHYQITRRFNSGTIFRYLYDRGSLQSQEIAQNGLARTPRNAVVTDADVRVDPRHRLRLARRRAGRLQSGAAADHADAVQPGAVPESVRLSSATATWRAAAAASTELPAPAGAAAVA